MKKKIRIRVKRPFIGYPGSALAQNYAEDQKHYYLLWDIKSKNDFTVTPKELPNPKPFITIDWLGNVEETVEQLKPFKVGSRVRVKCNAKIPLKYTIRLVSTIKDQFGASEVIIKDDHRTEDVKYLNAGATKLLKSDLRNPDVLLKLLQEHYKTTELHDEEWNSVYDTLKRYVTLLENNESPRNVKWSIQSLKFDNVFNYGEGNYINFEGLNGLVGLFAPNRFGKSALLGTLMYSLFNGTDRGSLKNQVVCNTRKTSCGATVSLNVAGKDYIIERTTEKRSNKQGHEHAVTDLTINEIIDGSIVQVSGEQRNDTEKVLRRLIGTVEDFQMTSITTQMPGGSLLDHGSSKRRLILSKLFDIDVLQQVHELAHNDVKEYKATLKEIGNVDWSEEIRSKKNDISDISIEIENCVQMTEISRDELVSLRTKLASFGDSKIVSIDDVKKQRNVVNDLKLKISEASSKRINLQEKISDIDQKLEKLESVLGSHDIDALRSSLDAYKAMKVSAANVLRVFETEKRSLDKTTRSLEILNEVPCGDAYPTCKFIKDAHELKGNLAEQKTNVERLRVEYERASSSLNVDSEKRLLSQLSKLDQLKQKQQSLVVDRSKYELEVEKLNSLVTMLETKLTSSESQLAILESQTDESKRAELMDLKNQIFDCELRVSQAEKNGIILASKRGKAESDLERLIRDQQRRNETLQRMKVFEIIESSFSKTGIQDMLLLSLLPIINDEIAKILAGIVTFTVELVKDPDNDQIDIYLNYGDERRLLELGSGMEKTISLIALRTALNNVSSLPKSDIFIIDEGFGTLDQEGIEQCAILLASLKQYFKTVLIITHVDQIKEVVDTVLEINKSGKDSFIRYE